MAILGTIKSKIVIPRKNVGPPTVAIAHAC